MLKALGVDGDFLVPAINRTLNIEQKTLMVSKHNKAKQNHRLIHNKHSEGVDGLIFVFG